MSKSHSRGLNEAVSPGGLPNKKDGVVRRTSQGLNSALVHLRMFNLKMSKAGDLAIPFKVMSRIKYDWRIGSSNSSHAHKTGYWFRSGVLFKISVEHLPQSNLHGSPPPSETAISKVQRCLSYLLPLPVIIMYIIHYNKGYTKYLPPFRSLKRSKAGVFVVPFVVLRRKKRKKKKRQGWIFLN